MEPQSVCTHSEEQRDGAVIDVSSGGMKEKKFLIVIKTFSGEKAGGVLHQTT